MPISSHRLGWNAIPFALDDLDSNWVVCQYLVSRIQDAGQPTFVSMVEDMMALGDGASCAQFSWRLERED